MKNYMYLTLAIVLLTFFSCKQEEDKPVEPQNKKNKIVVAYVNSWEASKWGDNYNKAKMITHINYAFANIKEGKVVEGNANDASVMKKLNELKMVNPDLKILISVGGWSWSNHFSDAVLTDASREIFAKSAVDFMLKHKLDGIDLDWEYPGQRGEDNVFRPEDKQNFTEILKLIREKLNALNSKESYLLTIATAANQTYLDHTNMAIAHQYLDFINIMTYDYFTGGSSTTGHHANLFKSDMTHNYSNNSAQAVQQHINAGIPVEKLTLGVPFYGRYWTGVDNISNGLYQKANGKRGSINYWQIADSIKLGNFKSFWDATAKAPFVWRAQDGLFLTYENSKSVKEKVNYILQQNMGGIMFWQFNGDNGELLQTIEDNLHRN